MPNRTARTSPSGPVIDLPFMVGSAADVDHIASLNTRSGALCWVESLRDFFALDRSSTLAVTPTTVRQPSQGTGRWIRGEGFFGNPSPWLGQAQWYLNATTGDDENDGATAAQALASAAELKRRLGPNPLVTQLVYVDVLSDLPEVIDLEATFSGLNAGIWIKAAPKSVLASDTCQAWTGLSAGVESAVQGTSITDFTAYEGRRCTVLSGSSIGGWFWLGRINSGAAVNEIARVSKLCYFNPATPIWSRSRFSSGGAMAPGNTFQVDELFRIGGLNLKAHRLDTGGDNENNIGTFQVQGLHIKAAGQGIITGSYSGSHNNGPRLSGCSIETGTSLYLSPLLLFGCAGYNTSGAALGYLSLYSKIIERIGCAYSQILFNGGEVLCSASDLIEGGILGYYDNAHNPPNCSETAAIWFENASYAVKVDRDASMRVTSSAIWGDVSNAGGEGFRIDGRLYYDNIADLNGLVLSGAGTDAVVGGTAKAYAALPYVEPNNNAMAVVHP